MMSMSRGRSTDRNGRDGLPAATHAGLAGKGVLRRALLGSVLSTLVLTACGSTVQIRGTASLEDGAALGAQSGGTTGGAGTTGGSVSQGPGAGQLGTDGAGASSLPGPDATSGGVGVTPATAPPAGTKLAPVQIGIVLFPDLNAYAGMFGGTANAGDQSLEVDTVVSWINRHGGIAGHPLQVVKHNVQLTSADTYDQMAQEACEDFTVDHHVIAVIAPGTAVNNNFAACLNKHGVLYLSSGNLLHDETDWKQLPNMWSPAEADGRAVAQAMVDLVLGRALAKKGETVGLMVMEDPAALRAADDVIKPQLKAAGISVAEYTVPRPASTQDIGNSVAVADSAELKMASQGIKTVMFLCPDCLGFFARSADSQRYYPTYVVSSLDSLAAAAGASNDTTMKTAVAVGWMPHKDVGLYSHPGELTDNPTRKLCTTIMAASAQAKDDLSEFATQIICDGFLQVMRAAELNPANPLTGPALQAGMSLFGTQHPSAMTFSTRLAPNHHGGATSYRTLHWDLGTHSFVYDSRTRLSFR